VLLPGILPQIHYSLFQLLQIHFLNATHDYMKKVLTIFLAGLFLFKTGISQADSAGISIIDDTCRFSSMEEIIQLPVFKNKVLYVDIWGTRCGPCIKEFAHIEDLKKRYENKPLVFLYLKSPYGFDDSKEWLLMLHQHQLRGLHIAMSQKFYIDNFWIRYSKKYTEERSYGIPTYLVISKNGQIVNFDAPRPGNPGELFPLLDREIQRPVD
jgi:thiol-disulfide isomerase/thioredoxin